MTAPIGRRPYGPDDSDPGPVEEVSTSRYVLDTDDLIWLVVRDGGMATRATYAGVVSIGIERLRQESGPLIWFGTDLIRHTDFGYVAAAKDRGANDE